MFPLIGRRNYWKAVKKIQNKIIDKKQSAGFQPEFVEKDYEEDTNEIKIIRTKKFGFKPMYPEDACVQMELLGHNFFVFSQCRDRRSQCGL